MNRVLLWGLLGALLGGGLASLIAIYDQSEAQMVIAGDLPLTDDQVRGQLASRGWDNLQLAHDDRYIEVSGTTSGRPAHMMIDSLTGKVISNDSERLV